MRTTRGPLFSLLTALLLLQESSTQECNADGTCDQHERCRVWRDEGECFREKSYMQKHCPVSCADEPKLGECKDHHERCRIYADLGECNENPEMLKWCAKSCGFCTPKQKESLCMDSHANCETWARQGECTENVAFMKQTCPKACNICTTSTETTAAVVEEDSDEALLQKSAEFGVIQAAEGTSRDETLSVVKQSISYLQSEQVLNLPAKILESCQNRNVLCSFWASVGECEKNQAYMLTNCAAACKSCHLIDIGTRCPPLQDPVPALVPGGLNKMFERIVETAPGNRTLTDAERKELADSNMTLYTVTVHSRPSDTPATEVSAVLDKSLPPWIITFDGFLTDQECEAMIQLGYKYEYKRSEDVGAEKFDGSHEAIKSERRTSENAWCSDFRGCRWEEVPQRLYNRMSRVMGIPANNSEDFQILKYDKGQFYRRHHDYIPHQRDRQCGPRILTFFLYLSDVNEGGGTNFPQLDITVLPKKGRALLWPSILDSDPATIDRRTTHQAMDVVDGLKYAANGWIHLYDYVTPQKKGCN